VTKPSIEKMEASEKKLADEIDGMVARAVAERVIMDVSL